MLTETAAGFDGLALAPAVYRAVQEIGYKNPSPIQLGSIPPLLAGRDLLGQAQTGTGKTAAFALPLLSRLDLASHHPQLLILTPTRELASQVAEAVQTYARHLPGFRVLPLYGGTGMSEQLRQLRRGVHAVVGTPGRILDHLRRATLQLDRLSCLVVDEADEMLKMGFIEDVEYILAQAPADRQMALFSATMPKDVVKIARRHLNDPAEIRIRNQTSTVATVTQRYWPVRGVGKFEALTRILEVEEIEAMIVFVRTKAATAELAEKLEAQGFSSAALNGDMSQALREKTVERLKNGGLDIVVATDVAARGLDVQRISHVVNYDMPGDTESYVHRIGRTGRAGRAGQAILFVAPRERRMLAAIEKATRQPIAVMNLPSRSDIARRRIEQFRKRLDEVVARGELAFFEELVESWQQDGETDLTTIAAALACMAQQDRPLQLAKDPDPQDVAPQSGSAEGKSFGGTGWQRYRLEVGRIHGVQPGHIVGAISNEARITGRQIGQIRILHDFCLVDLPENMPPATFRHLQKVWVCGQQLQLRPDEGAKQTRRKAFSRPRPSGKSREKRNGAGPGKKAPLRQRGSGPKR
jgi:ATP-dependent RNA helicase DeaD